MQVKLGDLELLTSERGEDGLWHARYPSATQRLCGQEAAAETRIGRRYPPDCGECARVARAFDAVVRSMPDHWRPSGGRCEFENDRGHRCELRAMKGLTRCQFHRLEAAA